MSTIKKKREFSKILWIMAMVHAVILSLYTMVIIFITGDVTPLEYLIPSVFAELAAATGFYFNKAKAENKSNYENNTAQKSMENPA